MSVHPIQRKKKGVGYSVRYRNAIGKNKSRTFDSEREANLFDKEQAIAKSNGTLIDFSEGKKTLNLTFE